METKPNTIIINNIEVAIEGERNLLEVIRKAGIDLPTFCYHSELSIYGACRLCLVEVVGKGVTAACATAPRAGMVIKTETAQLRNMRKINIELLLANHKRECPSCSRSNNCNLQDIARRLGVSEIRYKQTEQDLPIDDSSDSIVRDPNKCVLCGDCVRVCSEVQSVGAIDFAFRGAKARVAPAFDKDLNEVECVNCGQCAAVCPTGAIVPKPDYDKVWTALNDPEKVVVAQIAPAVRVALGEYFGCKIGENVEGKMISALKLMGFDYVYDTCFSADMTIFEEATELLGRIKNGGKLPMITSCSPGWVNYAEYNYGDLLGHLSSCKSPHEMFGAILKSYYCEKKGIDPKDMFVVSIMPCTAKKYEKDRKELSVGGLQDVDAVLTTRELGKLIRRSGINFAKLPDSEFDNDIVGEYTGAGVIFGTTGGVMEAALRSAAFMLTGKELEKVELQEVRGFEGIKEASYNLGGVQVNVAVAHGMKHAKVLLEQIRKGESKYHFIEIMGCPGGCIAGGGQPYVKPCFLPNEDADILDTYKTKRANALYQEDQSKGLRASHKNPQIIELYKEYLGEPNSHKAHELLHTHYKAREIN